MAAIKKTRSNDFKKQLVPGFGDALKNEKLFSEKLMPDIKTGEIFPSIRNNRVDFYYKGGKLFSYNKKEGFTTNIKYASACKKVDGAKSERNEDYIKEKDLKEIEIIKNFKQAYERIKENCSLYSGIEAAGVASLCKKYSYIHQDSDIVILDIETSFKSLEGEGKSDRIDLLLFEKKSRRLVFYEVKHYSNKEIWSKEGTPPKVRKQIKKYQKQIKNKEKYIINQYVNYVEIANKLFGLRINKPESISKKVPLLIFGFDRDQLQGRFAKLLKNDKSLENIGYYPRGDISGKKIIEEMWKRCNL